MLVLPWLIENATLDHFNFRYFNFRSSKLGDGISKRAITYDKKNQTQNKIEKRNEKRWNA